MSTFKAPTQRDFKESKAWGMLTAVDIHGCNPKLIRNKKMIIKFTHQVCKRIKVTMFGPTHVIHFGEDPRVQGFSMMQLIETSLVSAHFAEETNSIYLDVFSCQFYDVKKLTLFAMQFFKGSYFNAYSVLRGSKASVGKKFQTKMSKRQIILEKDYKKY